MLLSCLRGKYRLPESVFDFYLCSSAAIDDGRERRRGGQTRGDASPVSRLQGGAPHHRRRLHGHARRPSAGPGQDGLELRVVVIGFHQLVVHVSLTRPFCPRPNAYFSQMGLHCSIGSITELGDVTSCHVAKRTIKDCWSRINLGPCFISF